MFDPFDDFATRTVERTYDIVDTCEDAALAPIAVLGRRATEALRAALDGSGDSSARVVVTRRAGRLIARVVGAGAMATQERSRAAVRVMAALREIDPYAAGIDVGFGD